ncbi:NAD-dependent deacylase [Boseongicola aestuarii]|uniref:NAD-dependent protein deacylase n=1 Tax=Boseongicola aestuarii TaxID=1470561 RepID=A0A238J314_9RHOB|nr:NAD-dependent deacylase [Boseongicola aestuarii]SMX24565.1 NAD-dependent protein deacylase [Boseongicola aestuarii]
MKIVILTGAGVSAESGLGTFRDKDGLWTQYDLSDVATPEGFERDPVKVHDFYNARRANAAQADPNAAHFALARLAERHSGEVVLITQNVDGLHELAGQEAIHMHGALSRAKCAVCDAKWDAPLRMTATDPCPSCSKPATRPDIVWFGEFPEYMDEIEAHLISADLFVAIGTSGQVYPAAGFVAKAARAGAATLEINLEPSDVSGLFDDHRHGSASEIVPIWVDEVLGPPDSSG